MNHIKIDPERIIGGIDRNIFAGRWRSAIQTADTII